MRCPWSRRSLACCGCGCGAFGVPFLLAFTASGMSYPSFPILLRLFSARGMSPTGSPVLPPSRGVYGLHHHRYHYIRVTHSRPATYTHTYTQKHATYHIEGELYYEDVPTGQLGAPDGRGVSVLPGPPLHPIKTTSPTQVAGPGPAPAGRAGRGRAAEGSC